MRHILSSGNSQSGQILEIEEIYKENLEIWFLSSHKTFVQSGFVFPDREANKKPIIESQTINRRKENVI